MQRSYTTVALATLLVVTSALHAESQFERELNQLVTERENALASAAEPINRRHRMALEALLRRATQNNDLDAALKIKRALDAVGGAKGGAPTDPLGSLEVDPIGTWAWTTGRVITIESNGTFSVDKGGGGSWRWTQRSKGEFKMNWDRGGYVDTLLLSPDGKRISGSNNKGDRVNVSRIR